MAVLPQRDIILESISYLCGELSHNKQRTSLLRPIHEELTELKSLIHTWDIATNGDVVGYIYQELQNKSIKNSKGQYFTPHSIVEYLSQVSLSHTTGDGIKLLDPACGSGQFLIALFKKILHNRGGRFQKKDASRLIKNFIHGYDIDPIAVKIARFNLMKISGCDPEDINIEHLDFLDRKNNPEPGHRQKFDLIIGNPPWCSKFSIEEKEKFKGQYASINTGINTFTLFIERSFDFISPGGIISFLIPEAYLNIKAHRASRQFVLKNSAIKEIAVWGEQFRGVFAPSISLIIKNEPDPSAIEKTITGIKFNTPNPDGTETLIPQASFFKTHENIFNINYSKKAVNIINLIENRDCIYLKNNADFFLGIVTGDNKKHVSEKRNAEHPDPIIIGRDLKEYFVNFSSHYFKYDPSMLQQVAPQTMYLNKNKILYKFIGRRLIFAIDRSGMYSLNNVNGLIPKFIDMGIESTISILNSWVMQYFYDRNFFTVKVLRGNLEKLPLKVIQKENQKKLQSLTEQLIDAGGNSGIREKIEDIIFFEYGIKDKEAYIINQSCKSRHHIDMQQRTDRQMIDMPEMDLLF